MKSPDECMCFLKHFKSGSGLFVWSKKEGEKHMNKKSFKLTKKKGIIISVPLIALILCIIGYYVFIDNKLGNTDPNNEKIALYTNATWSYEEGVKDENYSLSSYNTITELASHGYILNETMSTCTNGATLTYDSTNKTVGLTTTSATQCTLYFDYSPHKINGTIEAYTAGSAKPVGTFNSISEAADAAGDYGKIVLSEGTFEFGQAQYIKYDGITLEGKGIDSTLITTGSNFASACTMCKYSLLTLEGTNITVKNLSFDGGNYGRTLIVDNANTEFSVIRAVNGSHTLQNTKVLNSNRNLLVIGDYNSNTSAEVTVENFICDGPEKLNFEHYILQTYPDIEVYSGGLTLDEDSIINCVIAIPSNSNAKRLDVDDVGDIYHLQFTTKVWIFTYYYEVYTNLNKMSYVLGQSLLSDNRYAETYIPAEWYSSNVETLEAMINDTINNLVDGNVTTKDIETADNFLSFLSYMQTRYPSNSDIQDWLDRLSNAYEVTVNQ